MGEVNTIIEETPYLLTRKAASVRYGMSLRKFDEVYRSNPDFPVLRIGHKVLIHRDEADAFFTRYLHDVIEKN